MLNMGMTRERVTGPFRTLKIGSVIIGSRGSGALPDSEIEKKQDQEESIFAEGGHFSFQKSGNGTG